MSISINNGSLITNIIDGGASPKSRILEYYGDFRKTLSELLDSLSDEKKDLVLNGRRLSAEEKNGAAGTYMIEEWKSEQDFIFSQLLESLKFGQSLENKLNNLTFSS